MKPRMIEITGKDAIMRKKMIALCFVAILAMLCLTGCGSGIETGVVYNGTTGQTAGTVSSTIIFNKDGTCTYEIVRKVSKGAGAGSEEVTESCGGHWSETSEKDNYEILLDEMPGTLYGKVVESGDIVISSDSFVWQTETFTKE